MLIKGPMGLARAGFSVPLESDILDPSPARSTLSACSSGSPKIADVPGLTSP